MKTIFFHLKQETWSEKAMSHSWVLGFHRRDHKGILPLEIASDLQQEKLYVFLPCLTLTYQVLAIDASRITS